MTRVPEQIFRGCWTLLKRWMGDDGSKTGMGGAYSRPSVVAAPVGSLSQAAAAIRGAWLQQSRTIEATVAGLFLPTLHAVHRERTRGSRKLAAIRGLSLAGRPIHRPSASPALCEAGSGQILGLSTHPLVECFTLLLALPSGDLGLRASPVGTLALPGLRKENDCPDI